MDYNWVRYRKVAPVDKPSVAVAIALSVLFLAETLPVKVAIGTTLIVAGTLVLTL